MDTIFKALADDTRRQILDILRGRDGRSLQDLEEALLKQGVLMTRFGVMKHLKVLEEANLVISHKQGRFKLHYLNVVPLQQVLDRWIEPLTRKPAARAVLDLKAALEGHKKMNAPAPDFILDTYINATAERLWQALISGDDTIRYYINGARLDGNIVADGRYDYRLANGDSMLGGTITKVEEGRVLDMTFEPNWAASHDQPSRVVFEVEAHGDVSKLRIMHFDIPAGQEGVKEGWSKIASKLKTYLETGETIQL